MIPIQDLIASLRQRGLQLWLNGEELGYRAPKGILSPNDRLELRARKPELIAFLRTATNPADHSTRIAAVHRTGNPPLSFAQQRLWFLYHLNGPEATYNIVSQHRLSGSLEVGALKKSFLELCRRHEILRTTFATVNGEPVQVISPEVRLPFQIVDVHDATEIGRLAKEEGDRTFDLTTGPLFTVKLLRLTPHDHVLLLIAHHIICDGWSLGILFRELSQLYRAFRHGQASPLPPPILHYADYAQWQRDSLSGAVLKSQLDYWRKLEGAPPVLDLFPERVPQRPLSSRGATVSIRIEPALAQQFKVVCQSAGATVFMGMLAVFQLLLARYTGRRDIVLGTQAAGRTRGEIESVPGFFVNTLPLRTHVDSGSSFLQLLDQVRRETFDAVAHQDAPFDRIVEMLQPERVPGRNPLVQIMLLWQNAPIDTLTLDDVTLEPLRGVDRSTAKFDLTLELGEASGGFEGVLEYRTDLFEVNEMRRLAGHFETLLETITDSPNRRFEYLAMLPNAERTALLADGLGERTELFAQCTIGARFLSQVRQHPHRTALVFGDVSLTYGELNARASKLAAYLRSLGIGPEIPVALLLEPSIELFVAMLAVLMAGGAYLPLDTKSPAARLSAVLEDSAAPVVLTVQRLARLLPDGAWRTALLDGDLPDFEAVDLPDIADPGNLAYIIYTSGSTGTPKGVMIDHRSVLNLTGWLDREVFEKLDGTVRTALIAPAAFDASVQQIFGCLLNGHTLYPVDLETRRDGTLLRRFFHRHGIQLADCTPSLLSILCDAGIAGDRSLALRCLLVGGEALSSTVVDEFYRQDIDRRISILNVYGPTECCVDSAFLAVAPDRRRRSVESIGSGIPNSELLVLDSYGNLLPEGVAGEICIAGAGLGRGYRQLAALTARSFVPHPFRSGERMYRSGDRGYWSAGTIEFLGRDDDQVKIRGHRIQLGDIESHLARHPGIRQACVVTRETPLLHKELVAYLVGDPALTVAGLRRFAAEVLPESMIPAFFVLLEALPLNGNGKVDRKRLPPPDEMRSIRQGIEFVAPSTEQERVLAGVWSAVLGRTQIGVRDHYIALGGDSIKALQISARLRNLGWKLELSDLFQHPCISALAPCLSPLNHREVSGGDNATGQVPLAPIQLRFFQEFEGAVHHFNQSVLLESAGTIRADVLRRALDAIYRHHDMLRATFSRTDGEWMQRVQPAGEPASFEIVDLTAASMSELSRHASAAQSALDLETGPLFRALLYRTPGGERLFLFAHHLIIDGVSWRILLEDLETAYRQAASGGPIHLPAKSASFRTWVEHLRSLVTSKEMAPELWPPALQQPGLPHDFTATPCTACECATEFRKLTPRLTADILYACHQAYGTDANEILLAALARALRRCSGNPVCAVLLEGHGRGASSPEPDVSRTIGWFTAVYPVVLDLGPSDDIERNIKLVKETLRRIPRKGLGYGLLRYMASPEKRIAAPEPGVVFNYLGQFSGGAGPALFSRAREDTGAMADPNARFSHDIEINALADEGCLRFHFSYNPGRYRTETMASFVDRYLEELETLAQHMCSRTHRELTPSDVDYNGFNLDEMESFLNNLPG